MDDTPEICTAYEQKDRRIRYHRNEVNLGMPGNLNTSLQLASSDYVANLHDGDVYHPDLLSAWKAALDEHPTATFVFNGYRTTLGAGREQLYREGYPSLISGKIILERLLSHWGSCVFGTVMARRSAYGEVGWFDPQFGNFSDVDMWMRLAAIGDVAYVDRYLMDLMPRDSTRFYSFVHWKVAFWILGMHTLNLRRSRSLLPEVTQRLEQSFPERRFKYLCQQMLLCVKHNRWDRVREGLAIWRHSDDKMLQMIGLSFGNKKYQPPWYTSDYWRLARI